MKNKFIIGCIVLIAIILQTQVLFAQWSIQNSAGNFWYSLLPASENSIGIGNFTAPNSPLSALHVNTNLLPTSTFFTPGELFRTDGPSNVQNSWRLWTGGQPNGPNPAEIGKICNFGNIVGDDHYNFSIQSSTRDMTFHTPPFPFLNNNEYAYERMRIVGPSRWVNSSNYLSREGNVGIGTASVFKTRKAKPEIADGGIANTAIGNSIINNALKGKNYFFY